MTQGTQGPLQIVGVSVQALHLFAKERHYLTPNRTGEMSLGKALATTSDLSSISGTHVVGKKRLLKTVL